MSEIEGLPVRELQKEAARALAVWRPGNNELRRIAEGVHQDSHAFWRAVVGRYLEEYGGMPSKVGPGAEVTLLHD